MIYGALCDAEVQAIDGVAMPWEQAEVLALLAAEEMRVGRLGYALAEAVLSPADAAGDPARIGSVVSYREHLPAALDVLDPGLVEQVWAYRCHELDLEDLWRAVMRASEGVLLYVAHTEAAHVGEGHAIAGVERQAVELLRPVWEPLLDHLRASPGLPEPGSWAEDRDRLRAIGLEGFTEVWRRLGLVTWPEGETFYLSVSDPLSPPYASDDAA